MTGRLTALLVILILVLITSRSQVIEPTNPQVIEPTNPTTHKTLPNPKLGVDELVKKYQATALPAASKTTSEEFNIIVILTDDQNYKTVQHMPRLQKMIADKGVVFQNAFATNPECCPFRASLLSGGFDSHETGVKRGDGLVAL